MHGPRGPGSASARQLLRAAKDAIHSRSSSTTPSSSSRKPAAKDSAPRPTSSKARKSSPLTLAKPQAAGGKSSSTANKTSGIVFSSPKKATRAPPRRVPRKETSSVLPMNVRAASLQYSSHSIRFAHSSLHSKSAKGAASATSPVEIPHFDGLHPSEERVMVSIVRLIQPLIHASLTHSRDLLRSQIQAVAPITDPCFGPTGDHAYMIKAYTEIEACIREHLSDPMSLFKKPNLLAKKITRGLFHNSQSRPLDSPATTVEAAVKEAVMNLTASDEFRSLVATVVDERIQSFTSSAPFKAQMKAAVTETLGDGTLKREITNILSDDVLDHKLTKLINRALDKRNTPASNKTKKRKRAGKNHKTPKAPNSKTYPRVETIAPPRIHTHPPRTAPQSSPPPTRIPMSSSVIPLSSVSPAPAHSFPSAFGAPTFATNHVPMPLGQPAHFGATPFGTVGTTATNYTPTTYTPTRFSHTAPPTSSSTYTGPPFSSSSFDVHMADANAAHSTTDTTTSVRSQLESPTVTPSSASTTSTPTTSTATTSTPTTSAAPTLPPRQVSTTDMSTAEKMQLVSLDGVPTDTLAKILAIRKQTPLSQALLGKRKQKPLPQGLLGKPK